jgi:hypothetical protein
VSRGQRYESPTVVNFGFLDRPFPISLTVFSHDIDLNLEDVGSKSWQVSIGPHGAVSQKAGIYTSSTSSIDLEAGNKGYAEL